ncbi:sugar kinase [Corallincola platygyrae]|uniref:Sugar kinase n=1 Tax=Corallincola platygyrae TaxID=1193278 RepID=A0ABW4XMM4_9GAMM
MKAKRVAVIGECMVELKKDGDKLEQGFGGDTLNTAVYLSRLTHQSSISVSYVTGLGTDPYSREMLKTWQAEHINTDTVYLSEDKLPGLYSIETTPEGERAFYYWRQDSAAKYWLKNQPIERITQTLLQHEFIYISGISLAILPSTCRQTLLKVLDSCRNAGVTIAFDNNYRTALWDDQSTARYWYEKMLQHTDIAFLTYDDEQELWGDNTELQTIVRTQTFGVSEVVIRRGSKDCIVVTREATKYVSAIAVDQVIDTTAAGDSFSAGYLAKRIQGGSSEASALSGHHLAGRVIQHRGAIIPKHAMP